MSEWINEWEDEWVSESKSEWMINWRIKQHITNEVMSYTIWITTKELHNKSTSLLLTVPNQSIN